MHSKCRAWLRSAGTPRRRAGPAGKAPAQSCGASITVLPGERPRVLWSQAPLLRNEDRAFKSATHRVSVGKQPSKSVFVKTSEAQPSRRDGEAAVSRTLPGLSHAVNPPRGLRTALAQCCTSDFRVSGGQACPLSPTDRQRDHCLQQQAPSE